MKSFSQIKIPAIEILILLVLITTYRAEPGEAGLGYGVGAVMVDLALSLRVGVVAWREALAGERGWWWGGVGWVVSAWGTWDGGYLVLLLGQPRTTRSKY